MARVPELPRVKHDVIGYLNPRCTRCGRTVMQIQLAPYAKCERMTLPFVDDPRAAVTKKAIG